ncbi:MAG TPA: GNAT family N-acetyltransferase, partial [Ignavibacteriaceae bacterium]|nr:GNAT family N-acetyltransferase [Ignavibacteriaceae bacterium]
MEYVHKKENYNTAGIYAIISEQENDEQWDSFVECNSAGFHEQTGMWASVKMLEGWNPVRIKFLQNHRIRGGFQILYKHKKYFGRIGYVSKGPLIDHYDSELWQLMITRLINTVKQYRIKALIIIPSIYNFHEKPEFDKGLFNPNKIFPVINATLQIDLTQSTEEILRGMRRRLRTSLKNTTELNFREGTREELETFFELMLITCKNQQVTPNPSSLKSLQKIWSLFSAKDLIKIYVAEKGNEIVSGILALRIRDLFIAWKIGWSGKFRSLAPNAALIWEMIKRAKKDGFKIFDFVSVDYRYAQLIKRKKPLTEVVIKNHTFFKLGFGGEIIRLPDSYIYI